MSEQRTTNRLLLVVIVILLSPLILTALGIAGCGGLMMVGCLQTERPRAVKAVEDQVKTQSAAPAPAASAPLAPGKPAPAKR